MAKKETGTGEVHITEVKRTVTEFCILGTAPIILNRMSQKARHELLLPRGRKTTAEKAISLKHEPLNEFRASPYTDRSDDGETRIQALASSFKKAAMTAALDLPGAKKAQIGRLVYVEGDRVPLYGVPQIMMAITRSADMNRTPDVRTRAVIKEWATRIRVSYVTPMVRTSSVANLLAAGGITAGVGDWRVEKGSGSYGTFMPVAADDPRFLAIIAKGGRAAQDEALANPVAYDDETEDLLAWYNVEATRRGFQVVS